MSDDKGWNGPLERAAGRKQGTIPGRNLPYELDVDANEREIGEVIVGGGGSTESEPYIMRYNGIETLALLREDGVVYIPSGCHIPSDALVELLRRGGHG